MLLSQFYQKLLPPNGIYSLLTVDNKTHYWATSIEDLVEATQALGDRTDIYFAPASFLKVGTAMGGRKQSDVDQLQCFKLDLDAGEKKLKIHGPEKVYVTQADAIKAVVEFTKETKLMFSLLVSSGEGLHVYYQLDEPVIPEAWRPVAIAFNKFGAEHGLKIDSSVTADHARVLRPIGTQHWNGSTVSVLKETPKVYTFKEFADAVEYAPTPKYDLSINEDFRPIQTAPRSFKKIILHCATMAKAYQDQEHIEEPYWRSAVGVCKHTMEGFEAAKAISFRHPSYDEEELQDKYDRWETGPSTCETFSGFEPSLCGACPHKGKITTPLQLGTLNVDEVEQLPEEQRPAPPPQLPQTGLPWDGCIPDDFNVKPTKSGFTLVHNLTIHKENELGENVPVVIEVPITHDIFWFGQWADASDSDDTAQVVVHKMDRLIKRSYLMEQTLVATRSDLTKYLASKGIHLSTDKRALASMEAYAKAQLQRIKNSLQRPKITDRFGIRILEDGRLVAAQGKYLIYPDGTIETAMLARGLRGEAEHYQLPLPANEDLCWDRSVWKSHIAPSAKAHVEFMRKFYSHAGFEKYQLAIMLGIASPLMAFVTDGYWKGATLPPNGLSLALFSENGGKGKTTAMRCAQLAYGLPSGLNKDNDDLNTTALGRLARFSISGTMPVNMDEMGDMDATALATLVRTIANGSGRVRATKDGGLNVSAPWSLICLIGTNKSQREIIAQIRKTSSAEQFRLLELDVEKMPQFGVTAQTAFETEWKRMSNHAGALGAMLHLMICTMGVEAINKLVSEKVVEAARMVQEVRVESASRFQYRALGAVLALYELMEARGFTPFPKEGVIAEFLRSYRNACEFVDENITPTDALAQVLKMVNDLHPFTIITRKETRRTMYTQEFDSDIRGRPPLLAKARYVLDDGMVYISSDAIKEWCQQNHVRESALMFAVKNHDLLDRIYPSAGKSSENGANNSSKRWSARYNLYKGMRENTGGMTSCYKIRIKALGAMLGEDVELAIVNSGQDAHHKVIELHPEAQAQTA